MGQIYSMNNGPPATLNEEGDRAAAVEASPKNVVNTRQQASQDGDVLSAKIHDVGRIRYVTIRFCDEQVLTAPLDRYRQLLVGDQYNSTRELVNLAVKKKTF